MTGSEHIFRERAVETVLAMDVPGSGPLELVRREAEPIVEAVLAVVCAALDAAYCPQNPTPHHPADAITKLFALPGHENIVEVRTADRHEALRVAAREALEAATAWYTGDSGIAAQERREIAVNHALTNLKAALDDV